MSEVVGVIPAAGRAERLQPLSGSKEVLRVQGRPVLVHLAERMRVGGATRLRVVTRPDKEDVVDLCRTLGAEVVLAEPPTVGASFAAGLGGLEDDDLALLGFPDSIWQPLDGYVPLTDALLRGVDAALGLFRVSDRDLSRSDVVVLGPGDRVQRVYVKPSEPPSAWIWGCAAARVDVLTGLARRAGPGEHFDALCRAGRNVCGVRLSDEWLDIGTRDALARALGDDAAPG